MTAMKKKANAVVVGAQLIPGHKYSAQPGTLFECLAVTEKGAAKLRSVMSGATFTAEEICMYEDGSISWSDVHDLHYEKAKQ